MTTLSKKQIKATEDLIMAERHMRAPRSVNSNLPKYEYETTSMSPSRPTKTLRRHPTKKVARSRKLAHVEEAQTRATVQLFNARSAFNSASRGR